VLGGSGAITAAFNAHDLDAIMDFPRRGLFAGHAEGGPIPGAGASSAPRQYTTLDGQRVRVRDCDHWEFRGDKIVRKDSYWKIVEPPVS